MTSNQIRVLDSAIHYVEEGSGKPIVFLHGNPTSSYLWRNVIPRLSGQARCLAPDLIGFGRSGKPAIDYSFRDHARYLDAWFDALQIERATLVLHDWGTTLGFNWASRHPERVVALAFMEAIVREWKWAEFPEHLRSTFQSFRTSGVGEKLIMEDNIFIERILPGAIIRKLEEAEMKAYREPFPTPADRKPIWRWPNELPIEGQPADVIEVIKANAAYLGTSRMPKLLLTFEPGLIGTPEAVKWCQERFANLEVRAAGKGIHYVQEDEPEAIGRIIGEWRKQKLG